MENQRKFILQECCVFLYLWVDKLRVYFISLSSQLWIAGGSDCSALLQTAAAQAFPRIKQKCYVVKYNFVKKKGHEENCVCPFLRSKYILLLVSNMSQQRQEMVGICRSEARTSCPGALSLTRRLYWCQENKYWLEEYFFQAPSSLLHPGPSCC